MQYTANLIAVKSDNFQMKKIYDNFLILAQNIDCRYTLEPPHWGGSNEYPQSMFWRNNKVNLCTPPLFSISQWGVRGYKLHGCVNIMRWRNAQIPNEPRSEKTGLRGFRPGPTQTGLYSHRRWLDA